jgi:hypothetical protein
MFPSKTWYFWNLFEFFSGRNHLKINAYLPHSESKSYQINSIKSCSSRSFQQHQIHIPIPSKFSGTILNFIFSEEIIQYSRTFATASPNLMEPSPYTPPPHRELSKDTKNTI